MTAYMQTVFTVALAYACVTLGLSVTLTSGQFSVAHAALMGIGGYASGIASIETGVPFPVALLIGAIAGAVSGLAFAFVLQRTSGMLLGTVTIAMGQAISLIVTNIGYLGRSQGYSGIPLKTSLIWSAFSAALALIATLLLRRSRAGWEMLAVGKDETVAQSLGISVLRIRLLGFGFGGLLAGLGGALLAHNNGIMEPKDLAFGAEPLFFIFLFVGGLTTPWGAFLGTLGMWWFQELLRFGDSGTFLFLDQQDRYWILGLVLVVVVLTRPSGLLTRRPERWGGPTPQRE
jgi:branched-chain amino acid transport system permease protein